MNYHYLFRIIILGHPGVGKTSLMHALTGQPISMFHEPTIGIDFATTLTPLVQGELIKTHLWDTAGQEYFSPIVQAYYRNVAGAIFVFAVNNRDSFYRLHYWINELKRVNKTPGRLLLVANKIDLHPRIVRKSEGEKFAHDHGMEYVEISVKNKDNTPLFFYDFLQDIYDSIDPNAPSLPPGIKKPAAITPDIMVSLPPKPMPPTDCCVLL